VKYTMARVRNPEYSTDMKFVRDELGIIRVYSRKALQKKWNKKTLIPFLREVYGNAKVGDRARVEDFVRISGSASVLDSALINKGTIISHGNSPIRKS